MKLKAGEKETFSENKRAIRYRFKQIFNKISEH